VMISNRLHAQASSAFPQKQGFFHSSSTQASCLGKCTWDSSEDRHRLHAPWTGCTRILQDKHRLSFLYQDYTRSLADWLPRLSVRQSDPMDENPPSRLTSLFYLHAPGLTLVTLGTACIPSVRLPPTTWEITVLPKDLG
jgi:hypothetical protein